MEGLDRATLAALGREYLLAGQLMDRAGMPHVISAFGREVMGEIAVDEWMGASPIYTRRIQRLLGFANGDVETIFKGMQFDIGAPPEFMDFRYNVLDDNHGEFWLDHCGALMDVEPMGDAYVTTMCHDIEDPTFDATATATNPRARMTAIHRPPREPADRQPHCHWQVTIDEQFDPLPDPAQTEPLLHTNLVALPIRAAVPGGAVGPGGAAVPGGAATDRVGAARTDRSGDARDEGWCDYTAPLDPDLRLEAFSAATLEVLLDEFALQSHLLVMSLAKAIEKRSTREVAVEIIAKQFIGSATITAERISRQLDTGPGLDAIARVLSAHPAFRPSSYVDMSVRTVDAGGALVVSLGECAATRETGCDSWMTVLAAGNDIALDSLVAAVDPSARCDEIDAPGSAIRAWRVTTGHPIARQERPEVALTRFSTGAEFAFAEPVAVGMPTRRGH